MVYSKDEIEQLSHQELIAALMYTYTEPGDSPEYVRRTRKYYSLLPYSELLAKALNKPLYKKADSPKYNYLESRAREAEIDEKAAEYRKEHAIQSPTGYKPVTVNTRMVKQTPYGKLFAELFQFDWIAHIGELGTNLYAVKLESSDNMESRVKQILKAARKLDIEGEILSVCDGFDSKLERI